MHHKNAFTLIELLIVIAVIAIVSIVVVLVLNPAELLRQGRDSNRLSDLATMSEAFGVYSAQGGTSYGSANTVYISIPDPSATSTVGDQCQGLSLISLPATYSYHCAATSTYRNVNGPGWIPVNFTTLSGGSPVGQLPIDPVNSAASRLYETYTTNGAQYELTSPIESQKYGAGGSNDVISNDGGTLASVYEKGTQLGLEPLDYGDSSLVGYWPLDEGTNTVAYDYSGNNATGSWSGTQGGTSGYYSAGKGGSYSWAGNFDGSTDYVSMSGSTSSFQFGTGNFSVSAWIYFNSTANFEAIVGKKAIAANAQGFAIYYNGPTQKLMYSVADGSTDGQVYTTNTITPGAWHYVVMVANSSDPNYGYFYVDGAKWTLSGASANLNVSNNLALWIGANAGADPFSGLIDDVRLYNRALTSVQVAAMYSGGK